MPSLSRPLAFVVLCAAMAALCSGSASAWHVPAPPAGNPGSLAGQMVILKSTTGFFVDNPDGTFAQKTILSRTDYYVYKEVGDRLYVRNLTEDGWIKKDVALLPADAVRYFDDVIRRRAKGENADVSPYVRRARAHEYALDLDAAIKDYDEAITLSQSFAYYNNRGNLHAKKHNVREAIADYERAIALNNTSPILHTNYANNLRKIASFDKAEAAYESAIVADANHVPAHLGKATMLRDKKEYAKAIAQYGVAAVADARSGQVLVERGETRVLMGDLEGADADFVKALEIDPIYINAHIQRALLKVRQKDFAAAIRECDEASFKDGKLAVVWVARARIQFAAGNPSQGLFDMEQAILREPKSPVGHNMKAWILATHPDEKVRDGKAAVAAAKKACELTGNRVVRYLDTLAAAYAEAGDFKLAVETMPKVLEDPFVKAREATRTKARLVLYEKKMAFREEPLEAILSLP